MAKWISGLFLGGLAITLSIFTGSRTLDLLAWALPLSQQIYQYLGLAAFEGGMYFWSFYFVAGAKGTPQRSISVIMAVFSIISVGICTIADMSIDAAQQGKIAQLSPAAAQAVIIFLGVVVVINVAAFLACKLLSIDNLRLIKEQSAEDQIYDSGLRAITALAPSIAADAAPYLAQEWANRTWQRIVPGVKHETYYLPPQEITGYRQEQAARRVAPSAIPDEETAIARNAKKSVVASKPAKRGIIDGVKGFFGGKNTGEAVTLAQESIDGSIQPSELTSNQIYRRERAARREKSRLIAENRLDPNPTHEHHIQRRDMRLARLRGPKSIDTPREVVTEPIEKVGVSVPLASGGPVDRGASSQIPNTPASGNSGKKRASARGATHAK